MFDGFNSSHPYLLPTRWEECPELHGVAGFALSVAPHTGEVLKRKREARFEGLRFEIKPTEADAWLCFLSGSLHSYRNGGDGNADFMPFADVCSVVANLVRFGIQPERATLHGLEIGLNIPLPFNPTHVFRSLVMLGNLPFVALSESDRKGRIAHREQYQVKMYDKGFTAGKYAANLLRVEVKVTRMQFLEKYGIRTLADLTDRAKVAPLVKLLLDAVADCVFVDERATLDKLTDRERADWHSYRVASTWQGMRSRKQRYKHRERLARLSEKCNAFDVRADLLHRIREEWERCLTAPASYQIVPNETRPADGMEAEKEGTFLQLESDVKNVPGTEPPNGAKPYDTPGLPFRTCRTCARNIAEQRPLSRFCSEKYKGPAARRCRNQDSNRRRNHKTKLKKAMKRNQWVRIAYRHNDQLFSDTLHSAEVAVSREWLDTVERIEILTEPTLYGEVPNQSPTEFVGDKARVVLTLLSEANQPEPPEKSTQNQSFSGLLTDSREKPNECPPMPEGEPKTHPNPALSTVKKASKPRRKGEGGKKLVPGGMPKCAQQSSKKTR